MQVIEMPGLQDVGFGSTCLDVNSSRPYLCATGESNGLVCLWDLRSMARPVAEAKQHNIGDCTKVPLAMRFAARVLW